MAIDLEKINLKFTASAGNVSKTFSALESRLSSLNKALNGLNTSKVDSISSSLQRMSTAMNGLGANTNADKAIRSLATSLNRMGQIDTASVARAASVMASLGNSMRTFPTIDPTQASSLTSLATSLNAFGRVRSVNGITGISTFATNLREMMTSLESMDAARLSQIAEAIRNLATALNILGRTKVGTAITNLPLLAKEMENLMQSLARAPNISSNVIQMTNALANLASNGSKVGTATSGLNRALNNTHSAGRNGAKGLDIFSRSAKSQHAHIKSLASVIGGLIAKYWILWRAVQMLGNMAGVASNLVEVQNVVDHTFGQMAYKLDDFTKSSIDNFGLSTLAAKQYASRFQSMGMAMGITNNQVAKSADFVSAHMTDEAKALYNTNNSLADMSINLTKLAADYASFYDVSTDEAFEKFQSVMTGQTRPLRAYGLDLTQATLKEFALKNGLDADIESMTQAEKTMLRYQYVMANSSHITSDFARTSDTFHNTLTKLKANFMTLKGTIGTSLMNLFKPIMVVVNNAIVVINQFAKAVGDSLGKILGWRYEVGSGAVEMEDMADYADDTASGLGKAGKAAQELKRQLQGFDELNNLTTNDDNGGGGSGGGGGGLGGAGGASNMAGQWVKEQSLFESDWDTWFKLGRGISEAWTEGLNSIDWDSVYKTFDNFGIGLASFLNGLITPDLFGALGTTIAGSLNSALHFLNSFGTTFDWTNFGNSIATGINSFFSTFDFKLAADTINKWSEGLLDGALAAVEGVDWKQVGNSITKFFSNLKLGNIAKKLSKLAVAIAQGLGTALSSTDWTEVGKQIGEAINGLDLSRIVFNLANLAFQILEALGKALVGIGEENPLAAAIIGIILSIKFANKLSKIGSGILNALGLSIEKSSGATLGAKLFNKINGLTTNYFGANTLTVAVSVVVAWKLGESIGKQLGNEIWSSITDEDMSEYFDNFTWSQFFGEIYEGIKDNVLLDAWNNMWSDFMDHISDWFEPARQAIVNGLRSMPGGELIADALGIDLDLTKEELEKGIADLDKLYKETGNESYKNFADSMRQSLESNYGSDTHTTSGGEHGGSSGKFGGGTFFDNLKAQYQEMSEIWQGKNVDFTIDSAATSPETVQTNYDTRSSFWQNVKSLFTVDSEATGTKTIESNYTTRKGYWKDFISNFKIDSTYTKITDIDTNKQTRENHWKDFIANFKIDSTYTKVPTIDTNMDTRKGHWKDFLANFKIDSTATKIPDIDTNRKTREGHWYGKSVNYSVNTGATPIQAVETANSAYQSKWKDKVANYAISFGVDAAKVNEFINSNVFRKINNTFASIPILKGFNIPYLATGAVVDGATLSVIGENGAEAVMPLERNTEWLGKMAGMIANDIRYGAPSYSGSSYAPANIGSSAGEMSTQEQNELLREEVALLRQIANKELTISEREVFNATRNASNNYYNRTGNSPFVF